MRFIPPHLMALITLLIIVLWVMLLRYFRRSPAIQQFLAELFGDRTPENALLAFELAKERLMNHLDDPKLDLQMRQRIEQALKYTYRDESTPSAESHPLS